MTMHHALRLTCFGLLLIVGQPSWATADAEALAGRLATHAPQCTTFKQSRWLADLETTLDSRGHFQRLDSVLIWHTTSPIEERLKLSEDTEDLPMSFQLILPIFTSLLAGDWQALERHFTINLEGEPDDWSADLTPVDSAVAEHLAQLSVQGDEHVEQLDIVFRDGDRLALSLSPVDCGRANDHSSSP